MGEVIPLHDPQDLRRVLQRIRKLWADGEVVILPHAQTRMRERGIDTPDIQHVIRYGQIIKICRPKILWRYTLQGKSVEGRRIACVIEITGRLLIVTVIDLTERKKKA